MKKLKIYIYCDKGVGSQSFFETSTFLSAYAPIEPIDAKGVRDGNWLKNCLAFVLPGGADLPYCKSLNGKGNQKISTFVQEGGVYLGICAGSYYGGRRVEFGKGTDLEVIGERELGFFPGMVEGPVFLPFDYCDLSGARRVLLTSPLINHEALCFYHGGGHFCEAEQYEGVSVLARYADTKSAAIIQCEVERGKALLSGVHIEHDTQDQGRLALIKALLEPLLEQSH